jgi:hypothetical protein
VFRHNLRGVFLARGSFLAPLLPLFSFFKTIFFFHSDVVSGFPIPPIKARATGLDICIRPFMRY